MGEIADMMLDGTMCEQCGVWVDDGKDGPGYPQLCAECQRENSRRKGHDRKKSSRKKKRRRSKGPNR